MGLKYNQLYWLYGVSVKGTLRPVKGLSEIGTMCDCDLLKVAWVKIDSSFLQMWTVPECVLGWQMMFSSDLEFQYRAGDKLVSPYSSASLGMYVVNVVTTWLVTKAFLVTVWWLFPLPLQPSRNQSEAKVWWGLRVVPAWLICRKVWLGKVDAEMQHILASDCLSSENEAQRRESSPTCVVKW